MISKEELRSRAKSIRKTLDLQAISELAVLKIKQLKIYKSAKNVLIFYPKKYEISLLDLLDDDKNFYLPKVSGNNLLVCPFRAGDILKKSAFNISEPCSNPADPSILDLVIVPALMADTEGYRLGYGGGFYDRFLSAYPYLKTILPVPKDLFFEKLPHDKFDKKADIIICC